MRLLFSCRQPSQRKARQKRRNLLFYNLPFNQNCIPPINLLCHANHPPNSGATISIPPTVQFPNHQICFLFLSNRLSFSTAIKCPKPISKRQGQLVFPLPSTCVFPTGLPSGAANFCPLPKSRFVHAFLPSKVCAFCTAKNVLRCN